MGDRDISTVVRGWDNPIIVMGLGQSYLCEWAGTILSVWGGWDNAVLHQLLFVMFWVADTAQVTGSLWALLEASIVYSLTHVISILCWNPLLCTHSHRWSAASVGSLYCVFTHTCDQKPLLEALCIHSHMWSAASVGTLYCVFTHTGDQKPLLEPSIGCIHWHSYRWDRCH